jgi:hypothetical protein
MRLQSDLNAFTERSDTDFDPTFKHSYAGLLTNTSNNCFKELTQLRAYSHKISRSQFQPGRIIKHLINKVKIDSKRIRIDLLKQLF